MAVFEKSYALIRDFEGGWCKVEGDTGGETYAGIARNFYPNWPGWSTVDIEKIHPSFRESALAFSRHLASVPGLSDLVAKFYRVEWWDRLGLNSLPQTVADEIFEQAVNLGKGGAARAVQRLCNALNYDKSNASRLFEELAEDGALGPKSLAALATLLSGRVSAADLVHALNGLQIAHYVNLAAKSFSRRKFFGGWLARTHDPAAAGKTE